MPDYRERDKRLSGRLAMLHPGAAAAHRGCILLVEVGIEH
jgi:hypothetical protein